MSLPQAKVNTQPLLHLSVQFFTQLLFTLFIFQCSVPEVQAKHGEFDQAGAADAFQRPGGRAGGTRPSY